MFPLPSQAARGAILGIHTRRWDPPPRADLLAELAQRCVGFCGADLKVLLRNATPVSDWGVCARAAVWAHNVLCCLLRCCSGQA